jgi:hypothetical protein
MVLQRLWNAAGLAMPKKIAQPCTFLFVCLAWVLFRAESLDSAAAVYGALFGMNDVTLPGGLRGLFPDSWGIAYAGSAEVLGMELSAIRPILYALAAAFACVFMGREAGELWDRAMERRSAISYAFSAGAAALLVASFVKMLMVPYTEFIFFNF